MFQLKYFLLKFLAKHMFVVNYYVSNSINHYNIIFSKYVYILLHNMTY